MHCVGIHRDFSKMICPKLKKCADSGKISASSLLWRKSWDAGAIYQLRFSGLGEADAGELPCVFLQCDNLLYPMWCWYRLDWFQLTLSKKSKFSWMQLFLFILASFSDLLLDSASQSVAFCRLYVDGWKTVSYGSSVQRDLVLLFSYVFLSLRPQTIRFLFSDV